MREYNRSQSGDSGKIRCCTKGVCGDACRRSYSNGGYSGVGKTTLATTFAKTLDLRYHRVQFTPDVLPSDILGFSMYQNKTGEFEFHPGSIFCNLFLADEINRTSPKTQSALLEVMEERQASVEGKTWALPDPFFVIATQNPSGSSGTQFLPESQLDRFMICLSMGYPSHQDAVSILKGEVWKQAQERRRVLTAEELKQLRKKQSRSMFMMLCMIILFL